MGTQWKHWETLFWGAPKSLQMVTAVMKLKAPWKKSYGKPRQCIKKERHYFADKGPSSQSYGFSSSHAWMWELDHKDSWASKNWCFWTVVLEKTLGSPLDCKGSIQSILKEISPEYSLERLMLKLNLQFYLPPVVKNWVIGKDPDTEKDLRQKEKGTTKYEMVGWHHWLDGHEFEQAVGVGDGQGSLVCCIPWGRKESDATEWLNWTETFIFVFYYIIFLRIYVWYNLTSKICLEYQHDSVLLLNFDEKIL